MNWALGLFFVFFQVSAVAMVDSSCFGGDCLRYGWSNYNTQNGYYTEIRCKYPSCAESGWHEVDSLGRLLWNVECQAGGCFNQGFIHYTPIEKRVYAYSDCVVRDRGSNSCLRHGWVNAGGYERSEVVCSHGDCQIYGWDLWIGARIHPARCKPEGCFKSGWHQY